MSDPPIDITPEPSELTFTITRVVPEVEFDISPPTTGPGGDFDPADFATAEQGLKADTALQATSNLNADKLVDGSTIKAFLATERDKLSGVANGATSNSADASLLSRANHTGTQPIPTIDGLPEALDSKVSFSSVGANNGVASLDGSGKVPNAQLPSLTTSAQPIWIPASDMVYGTATATNMGGSGSSRIPVAPFGTNAAGYSLPVAWVPQGWAEACLVYLWWAHSNATIGQTVVINSMSAGYNSPGTFVNRPTFGAGSQTITATQNSSGIPVPERVQLSTGSLSLAGNSLASGIFSMYLSRNTAGTITSFIGLLGIELVPA